MIYFTIGQKEIAETMAGCSNILTCVSRSTSHKITVLSKDADKK